MKRIFFAVGLFFLLCSLAWASPVHMLGGKTLTGGEEPPPGEGFVWSSALNVYYRFETSPGFLVDSSGHSATLTNAGAAVQNTDYYKEGAASADFAGTTTDQLYITDANLPAGFPGKNTTGYQNFLISFWVRPDGATGNFEAISKYYAASNERSWEVLGQYTTELNFRIYLSAEAGTTATVSRVFDGTSGTFDLALTAGTWYHVGLWHDSTLDKWGLRVKEDGGSTYNYSETYTSGVNLGTGAFAISGRRSSGGSASGQMDGKIDKVAIYSWADGSNPTEAEIITQIDALSAGTAP